MTETSKHKITFKVFELEYVINLLESMKLAGFSCRMRERFTKLLWGRLIQFKDEYTELFKEYALFDEDGNPISEKLENGQTLFKLKETEGFEISLNELTSEEFCIQIDDNNKNMIKSVRDSILNCPIEFSGEEATNYCNICDRFENLQL